MSLLSELHFIRPWFLLLLPIVIIVVTLYRHQKNQADGWQQICEPHLLQSMQNDTKLLFADYQSSFDNENNSTSSWLGSSKWTLLYFPVVILSVIALAGPAFRKLPLPVTQSQSAWVIALDVSKSMLANDLTPSRLQRAKYTIQDLLALRSDGLTALIAYSGAAFTATPLTDDKETILNLLGAIEPDVMPVEGTNTLAALDKAEDLLKQSQQLTGDIILVTDEINTSNSDIKDKIQNLAKNGYKVSVVAVGTVDGSPIPSENGFVKDDSGNIVVAKTNFDEMAKAAKWGDGQMIAISSASNDLSSLIDKDSHFSNQLKHETKDDKKLLQYADDGYWLLVVVLPMLLLLYRRGLLLSILLVSFLSLNVITPQPAFADEVVKPMNKPIVKPESVDSINKDSFIDKWFKNDQQQAYQKLLKINANKARATKLETENTKKIEQSEQFDKLNDSELKAALAYEQNQYDKATKYYAEQIKKHQEDNKVTAKDYYNLGNAQAQSAQLEKALDSYKKSLELDATDKNTLYNKKLVEDAINKKQDKSDNKSKDQQGKDQQGKDQQGKDQQGKDQQGKDQQGKDQQGKDQQGKDQQSKDQQGKDQQGKDQQGKDQQSKDQQGKDQQSKDQQGKDQQGKDQQGKDQQGKDQQGKDQQGKDQQGKDQQGKDQQGKDTEKKIVEMSEEEKNKLEDEQVKQRF